MGFLPGGAKFDNLWSASFHYPFRRKDETSIKSATMLKSLNNAHPDLAYFFYPLKSRNVTEKKPNFKKLTQSGNT